MNDNELVTDETQHSEGQNPLDVEVEVEDKPKTRAARKPKQAESNVVALHSALTADAGDAPSIGRIVRYVTSEGKVRPAIVIEVNEDSIDVNVFTSLGTKADRLVTYDQTGEKAGTYHWPTRD